MAKAKMEVVEIKPEKGIRRAKQMTLNLKTSFNVFHKKVRFLSASGYQKNNG